MGLFSINYNKPGPGVSKDAPVKKPFFRFWEVYFRKFFDLIKLNMLFAIPTAVTIVLVFAFGFFISGINQSLSFLGYLPFVLLSPFVAGLTFVCRNYAREEHAFILSDFWDAVKNNWKQFLVNGLICYVFYMLMSVAISFYSTQVQQNSLLYVPLVVCLVLAFLFICAQFYIPVMIITFDLSLSKIYKNALIFAIVGLWRNLMLIAIIGVFILAAVIFFLVLPPLAITVFIMVLLVLLIFWAFGFFGFLVNFAVYPLLVKYIIKPYEKEQEDKKNALGETSEEEEDEPDFQDSLY